jgi:hypothetical protein
MDVTIPWQLARFGAVSELLGRPVRETLGFTTALGPQLAENVRVVLGSDLETIGLQTRVEPQADPGVLVRVREVIGKTSGAEATAWWDRCADAVTPFDISIMFRPKSVNYALSYDTSGWTDVLESVSLPPSVVADLKRRIGPLDGAIDRVMYDQIDGAHRIRFDAITQDASIVTSILDRSRIPTAQRNYFHDTTPVWTANDPRIAVRIATRDSGPLDQVGVMFAEVAGENMMRAWKTFRARPDFDKKLGAFFGAMGHEVADLFELRFYRTGEPQLEATFTPSPLPFGRKPITA